MKRGTQAQDDSQAHCSNSPGINKLLSTEISVQQIYTTDEQVTQEYSAHLFSKQVTTVCKPR